MKSYTLKDIDRFRPGLWTAVRKYAKHKDLSLREVILTAIELLVCK